MLSEEVRSFFGVDIINVSTEEEWERHRIGGWERWVRKMMGLIYSPYYSCQAVTWDKCTSMGDRLDSNNLFSWEKLVMNLLGTKEYNCQRPWVFKKRVDGLLDVDLFIYVDDGRPIVTTENLC